MKRSGGSVRTIECPACGGTLEVRAAGWSVSLACRYCGSILDVSRPEVRIITAYKRAAASFALELGVRGELFGQEWQAIGALKRRDALYRWQEFLLLNPYLGYRWLVVCDGEWQFGTMLLDRPAEVKKGVDWRGTVYRRQGPPQTTQTEFVIGEFYWRVARGDKAEASQFERGDEVLSQELVEGEETWTQLVPVDEDVIRAAFAPNRRRQPRAKQPQGTLAFKPDYGRERDDLPMMFAAAFGAAIITLLAMVLIAGPVERANAQISAPYQTTLEGHKVGTLIVRRPWQFVRVRAQGAYFDNHSVDLDYSLVDQASGQSIDSYGLVEHYSGRDSDGPWTEGDRSADTLVGRVPAGTYDLYVDAQAHSWPIDGPPPSTDAWTDRSTIDVVIEAEVGALPWGNWFTLVLLLFTVPCVITWNRWKHHFS